MIELFKLNHSLHFPSLNFALEHPNGLLAYGGDLSVERLVAAYKQGIFPWFSEEEPILWWSPDPRAVIDAAAFTANKSLKKSIRRYGYYALLNHNFERVIRHCANVPRGNLPNNEQNGTWISEEMICAYINLHQAGYAHSVEIYDKNDLLVGGLYGVVVSGIFCGESMFHLQTDASKAAFDALAIHMRKNKMWLIDCQLVNPHLERLGCKAISRQKFISLLAQNKHTVDCWHTQALELSA